MATDYRNATVAGDGTAACRFVVSTTGPWNLTQMTVTTTDTTSASQTARVSVNGVYQFGTRQASADTADGQPLVIPPGSELEVAFAGVAPGSQVTVQVQYA